MRINIPINPRLIKKILSGALPTSIVLCMFNQLPSCLLPEYRSQMVGIHIVKLTALFSLCSINNKVKTKIDVNIRAKVGVN